MKMIGEATVKKTAGQDWAGRKTAERGMTEKEGTGNITEKKAIKEKTIEAHVIKKKMAEGNLIKEKKTEFDVIKEKMTEGSAIKEGEIKERLITEGAVKEKAAEKLSGSDSDAGRCACMDPGRRGNRRPGGGKYRRF